MGPSAVAVLVLLILIFNPHLYGKMSNNFLTGPIFRRQCQGSKCFYKNLKTKSNVNDKELYFILHTLFLLGKTLSLLNTQMSLTS